MFLLVWRVNEIPRKCPTFFGQNGNVQQQKCPTRQQFITPCPNENVQNGNVQNGNVQNENVQNENVQNENVQYKNIKKE